MSKLVCHSSVVWSRIKDGRYILVIELNRVIVVITCSRLPPKHSQTCYIWLFSVPLSGRWWSPNDGNKHRIIFFKKVYLSSKPVNSGCKDVIQKSVIA